MVLHWFRNLLTVLAVILSLHLDLSASAETRQTEDTAIRIASLSALLNSINSKLLEIDEMDALIEQAANEAQRADLLRKANALQSEKTNLERQFEEVAGGVDTTLFTADEPVAFDLQSEALAILKPLFSELQRVTSGPRELDRLEEELDLQSTLKAQARSALQSLDSLVAASPDGHLTGKLEAVRDRWQRRYDDAGNQSLVLSNQLNVRLAERESITDNLRLAFTDFVRSRGIHFLFGVLAFVGVYFFVRLIHRAIAARMVMQTGERSIYTRFIDVALHVLAFLLALLALVFVFILTNDFVLLLLTAIFVAGLAWGGVKLIPALLDELRLVLNLGPVREGERVIYGGIPWRVDNLGFQTHLSNPSLTGGRVTMPVRGLVDMQSRPFAHSERWFPCSPGDWIRLEAPMLMGKVLCQTPEFIEVRLLGGSRQTISTSTFLGGCPANLSEGFRLNRPFSIGHDHREEAAGSIPHIMEQALRDGLQQVLASRGRVIHVAARIEEVGRSTLDYNIEADFSGEAAELYEELGRQIAMILVRLANHEQWTIPNQQITLHQAAKDA